MRTVLITGCSSGIGQALCEQYLLHGFKVFATARNVESLSHFTDPNLIAFPLDVNDPVSINNAIAAIRQHGDSLDTLINNAGYAAMGPLVDMPLEDLQNQFATNVFAPMELTKAALPLLLNSDKAQVVNVGSVSGITTTPFSGAYCATKSALHSLSDALRMELAPFGIQVVTVQPGAIESKFGDNSLSNLLSRISDDSIYAKLKDAIKARATASQDDPTPAEDFAKQLLAQLLSEPKPVIRIGNGSTTLPLLKKLIPTLLLDKILSKKFELNQLEK